MVDAGLRAVALAAVCLGLGPACSGPGPAGAFIDSVTVEPCVDVGPCVTVRWTTTPETDGYVDYGVGEPEGHRRDSSSGRAAEHEAVLLGVKPSRTYQYKVVAVEDGEPVDSMAGEFHTSAVPVALGGTHVQQAGGPVGGFVVASTIGAVNGVVVFDRDGDYLWWHLLGEPDVFAVGATLAHDSGSVLYGVFDPQSYEGDDSCIVEVSLDGAVVQQYATPGLHHDLAELPDGTLAYVAHDIRETEGGQVRGDRIMQVERGGEPVQVWSVWDHLEFVPDGVADDGGWTHANSVAYDPDTDRYLVSLRNLGTVVEVDRGTGQVLRWIGGSDSDLEFVGIDPFEQQHEAEPLPGGLLVFDNGTEETLSSRVVELALDDEAGVASHAWSFTPDPPTYVPAFGGVHRLASGDTLISWSSAGQIDEVTPAGEVVWRLNSAMGVGFGYPSWIEGDSQ